MKSAVKPDGTGIPAILSTAGTGCTVVGEVLQAMEQNAPGYGAKRSSLWSKMLLPVEQTAPPYGANRSTLWSTPPVKQAK